MGWLDTYGPREQGLGKYAMTRRQHLRGALWLFGVITPALVALTFVIAWPWVVGGMLAAMWIGGAVFDWQERKGGSDPRSWAAFQADYPDSIGRSGGGKRG